MMSDAPYTREKAHEGDLPMHRSACCVVLMVSVAACSHPSSTTYGDKEVGQTIETAQGSVVSSRVVDVSGEPGFVGAGAGAAVGASGGALAVNGPASLLVAIVGGLVGAGIGYMAEKQMGDRDGIEYVLQMDDGRLVTLVQNREDGEQPLADGTPVLVQLNGQYTRVMAHPNAVDRNAGSGWVDPDTGSPAATGSGGGPPAATSGGSPGAPPPNSGAAPGARDLMLPGGGAVARPGDTEPSAPVSPGGGQQQ
jgi:outer membrane lipoprotein SlyB